MWRMSSTPQKFFFFLEHRSHENTPFGHFLMWRSTPHQESTPHQGKNTPHQEKTYAASGFGNAQTQAMTIPEGQNWPRVKMNPAFKGLNASPQNVPDCSLYVITDLSWKFHENLFIYFTVMLLSYMPLPRWETMHYWPQKFGELPWRSCQSEW